MFRDNEDVWAVVIFDVPTLTKEDKRQYRVLRDTLLTHGMLMLQYSVYARFFPKGKTTRHLVKAVESALPCDGKVTVFVISDAEYSQAFRFVGETFGEDPEQPDILTLF